MADLEQRKTLTREGYEKLENELNYLKTIKREEISAQIAIARGFGDLSENAEYDEARKDQARNETKILEIEEILSNCAIVENDAISTNTIGVGNTVVIRDHATGTEMTVTLVSANEIDPAAHKISTDSPIGKALVGKTQSQIVDIVLPHDVIKKYEIVSISR